MTYFLSFSPPAEGFVGRFNTIRVSHKWAKRLAGGEKILLVNSKDEVVIGWAIVEQVIKGKLGELSKEHAQFNHNQIGAGAPEFAPERLMNNLKKRSYFTNENSNATVIYMRMIEDGRDQVS